MVPAPSVLISLSKRSGDDVDALRDRIEDTVRDLGYASRFTTDARQTVDWVQRERFAVSFLDSEMEADDGGPIWRVVRPILGRRMVLMTREPRRVLWFEALTHGVATVLPLPPRRRAVRAAFLAAAGPEPEGTP